MNNRFEVSFSVYHTPEMRTADTNMCYLTTVVECFQPQQAQAMIEAQYRGCAQIHSVRQI